jgi:hypothetical protein
MEKSPSFGASCTGASSEREPDLGGLGGGVSFLIVAESAEHELARLVRTIRRIVLGAQVFRDFNLGKTRE